MKNGQPSQLAVAGLGYVGLSLAVAFGRSLPTLGFDTDPIRIKELQQGHDRNGEILDGALRSPNLRFTSDSEEMSESNFIVVAVPTPVDRASRPDLSYLMEASRIVGRALRMRHNNGHSDGSVVVYESTVYPGCTEEQCIPVLERESGLKAGRNFKVAYSPERINPGDPEHTLEKVVKVVAAQDAETADYVARVYGLVVKAGVYKAPDIHTAEAAKVIENVQRDLNIALMNELAVLFHRLGLDTKEVLRAARTKWNFLPFEPGLVGGDCIPVNPYYLTHRAREVDYHPELILAGRRINDSMGVYVAQETVKLLIEAGKEVGGAKVLVLGVTFKENVRDVRNTRVVSLVHELQSHGVDVVVHDPLLHAEEITRLGMRSVDEPFEATSRYEAIILAVPHKTFREKPLDSYVRLLEQGSSKGVLVDVKGVLRDYVRNTPFLYWTL